jgi:hypothetical protein
MIKLVRAIDVVAVVGVVLSVAISVVLKLTTDDVSVGESFIIGLVGTNIALVLDFAARNERRHALTKALGSVEWLGGRFLELAGVTREVLANYPDSEVSKEVLAKYERLGAELADLRGGSVRRPGDDFEHLLTMTAGAREEIRAVTNIQARSTTDLDWWSTDFARRYWQANVAALARGVRIVRLFVYREMDEPLARLIEEQSAAGVEVGLVQAQRLEPSLQLNFVIWDGAAAWEAQMSAHGDIIENRLHLAQGEINRLNNAFKVLALGAGPV